MVVLSAVVLKSWCPSEFAVFYSSCDPRKSVWNTRMGSFVVRYESLWELSFPHNSVLCWENMCDLESTKMEIVRKREGHNPAWMKALCIVTSSVLPLNHHQETKDKSECSAVKPKCYILILFCPKHFRLSAQQYIRFENPTWFGIFFSIWNFFLLSASVLCVCAGCHSHFSLLVSVQTCMTCLQIKWIQSSFKSNDR